MPGHDIITIGASAGGVDVFRKIVAELPADMPAAIFIVQHIRATEPTLLPGILDQAGPLPARLAQNGEPVRHAQVYVAPPDHHMLIEYDHVHIIRGPKENGFRPAIDATFRTAARAYGARVVGVVLSGMLDDGTAGLLTIKRHGGIALVQAPAEADFPNMPVSALRYVTVDAVLATAELPAMLLHLANEPAQMQAAVPRSEQAQLEANISKMDQRALQQASTLGTPVPFSCPDCGGVLVEYHDGDLLRFRCQVGHAYSPESLVTKKTDMLDYQMWAAYQALDERATLARRLAEEAQRLNDPLSQRRFTQRYELAERKKEQLRQILLEEEDLQDGF